MTYKTTNIISLIVLCTIAVVFFKDPTIWLILSMNVLVIRFLVFMYASYRIDWNFYLRSVCKGTDAGVSITFDDGPDPILTPQILDILEVHHVKATFFVIGAKAVLHPEIVNDIFKRGHIVANHSYSHSKAIGIFSSKKLSNDLKGCSEEIKKCIGKSPNFFRPPFGVTNPQYKKVLNDLKIHSIGWTLRSYDSVLKSKEALIQQINSKIKSGTILLLHDNRKVTLEALPEIIALCKKKAGRIIALDEHINLSAYNEN